MDNPSYVYILSSENYGNLYVGVTADLVRRAWQHREGLADGFTKKYAIKRLVWYEVQLHRGGDQAGKANQKMESGLEGQPDPAR
ncbi:MAG: GIY-YIG nuclease family protein [Massilia sp.]